MMEHDRSLWEKARDEAKELKAKASSSAKKTADGVKEGAADTKASAKKMTNDVKDKMNRM